MVSLGIYKVRIIPLVISFLSLLHFNKSFAGSFPGKVICSTWKSSWAAKSWFSLAIWSGKDFVLFYVELVYTVLKGEKESMSFSLTTDTFVPKLSITLRSSKLIYGSNWFKLTLRDGRNERKKTSFLK